MSRNEILTKENAIRTTRLVEMKKTVDSVALVPPPPQTRRAALGNLGNRIRSDSTATTGAVKKAGEIRKPNLKDVKPRVDTRWNCDVTSETVVSASDAETKKIAPPQRAIAKITCTARPQESVRIQIAGATGETAAAVRRIVKTDGAPRQQVAVVKKTEMSAATSRCVRTAVDATTKTAIVRPLSRQESKLTNNGLAKLREAINRGGGGVVTTVTQQQQLRPPKPADVENIDSRDRDNIFLVAEYVDDIYEYHFHLEQKFAIRENFIDKQVEVTARMRAVLIDWMNEVHFQFQYVLDTYYMAVSIVDRYLQQVATTTRSNLQLVGVTALFIAAKYEEVMAPEIDSLVYLTDSSVTKKQIIDMERHICKKLNFEYGRPLPIHFLRRFSKAAHADEVSHTFAKYVMELSTIDSKMSYIAPSKIAAASLYLALRKRPVPMAWSNTLEHYTRYAESDLQPTVKLLVTALTNVSNSTLKTVYTKYGTPAYLSVSTRKELQEIRL